MCRSTPASKRLSGGVGEWEDTCFVNEFSNLLCRIRGAPRQAGEVLVDDGTRCDYEDYGMPPISHENVGFRCCADLADPTKSE